MSGAEYDHAIAGRHDAVAGRQSIGQDGRSVEVAVTVRILQPLHGAILVLGSPLNRVIRGRNPPHLAIELSCLVLLQHIEIAFQVVAVDLTHQDPAPSVEGHGHRIGQERLTGHDLDAKSLRHAKQLLTLCDRQRTRRIVGQLNFVGQRCRRAEAEAEQHGQHAGLATPGQRRSLISCVRRHVRHAAGPRSSICGTSTPVPLAVSTGRASAGTCDVSFVRHRCAGSAVTTPRGRDSPTASAP